MIPVFVYGTLRRGEGNSHILSHSIKKDGLYKLAGYNMYSVCSSFPGIIPGDGEIVGEVALVDDKTLYRLDMLEGVPFLYDRKEVILDDGSKAWTYVFQQKKMPAKDLIAGGDWVEYIRS